MNTTCRTCENWRIVSGPPSLRLVLKKDNEYLFVGTVGFCAVLPTGEVTVADYWCKKWEERQTEAGESDQTPADIRLCNHFTPDKYCDSAATGICVALRGQPCKWLDEVVRPLAPYGYIVGAAHANAAVFKQEEALLDYYLGGERKEKP